MVKSEKDVEHLIQHLYARRETILSSWRTICIQTQTQITNTSFSQQEFNDHVPAILDILAQRLKGEPDEPNLIDQARDHGLHRWQHGYSLPELLTELEILYGVILDEVQGFQKTYDKLDVDIFSIVHRQVFNLFGETSRGSVLYYDKLRQTSAAAQANAMQHELEGLEQLSKDRSEHLRHSTHDLRSGFSFMVGATQLLQMPNTQEEIIKLVDMLNLNLSSIRGMLFQLTDYAPIEANQETLDIKEFDVAAMLQKVVSTAQPIADQHNLTLRADGPSTLFVKSDSVKVQRIVQNLLYNALKYTKKGGIYISWTKENDTHWTLSIQDTGPGYKPNSPVHLSVEQLKPLGQPINTHQAGGRSGNPFDAPPSTDQIKNPYASQMKESEGLGLFIVKKLCELLSASMDIESEPGEGTLVRVRFILE
ncbi:sensor histidine kinase [Dyadobacter arcticus]|uniref:histidine kinase n=1 Tax=Dyadobacter arcticus TaxID=1078754 RepID=A0ABX0ULW4_9BACT|nr:sensor histidine kinase [Dyadobacter arcticus]NIJ52959.1 signal transduction histidine kinase [Dyadobacter arcticus]